MNTPEYVKYFYLRKVDEVRARAAADDYYHLIMASGLLRHLLLEDFPLIHKANKDLRLKIRFEIWPTPPFPESSPKPKLFYAQLDPHGDKTFRVDSVKVDGLLATHCLSIDGIDLTVKDVLESCAYARGGVHLHTPNEIDMALFEIDGARIHGIPMTMSVLRDIINIVLKGLQPLTDAVTKQLGFESEPQEEGASAVERMPDIPTTHDGPETQTAVPN